MGDAYTPGLTVTRRTVVRKTRRLPLPGEVLKQVGDRVGSADVVARTDLPGKVHLLNLATALGLMPDELAAKLTVAVGGVIKKGQTIAENRSFFGLFTNRVAAPIDGTLESVSEITGQAVMREPPVPVEVRAYVDGTVVEIIAGEGVVVETEAALVQGIFGLSGEVNAPLVVLATRPDQKLDAADFQAAHTGKVVLGGGQVTLAGMRRAMELKVAAVVTGGFAYQDIKELLGYDVGVAITGTEGLATTLVVTEGFGDIAMAGATYDLLASMAGKIASVCGATQIRAGVIRPEVVVPGALPARPEDGEAHHGGLEIGAPVRCIRAPYFGRIGKVASLPVDLFTMPSETRVRVLEVDLGGGELISVPRANVEVIER
jgi:biotin carboxyl carrier protein